MERSPQQFLQHSTRAVHNRNVHRRSAGLRHQDVRGPQTHPLRLLAFLSLPLVPKARPAAHRFSQRRESQTHGAIARIHVQWGDQCDARGSKPSNRNGQISAGNFQNIIF